MSGAPGAAAPEPVGGPLRRAWRWVLWYLRELTGEAHYDRYCARYREHHPGAPVPTPREYQRMRTAHQEASPQSRCC
ncbi:YbdD/YjiX family protein [Streptomyces sp. AmelKG-E11A]|uniref:YbdD/YjiX family protein n=1 Tax=Streptomyces sp. AmelKG-E11A TaxID=1100822 RepID=UPI00406D48A5